MRQCLAAFTSPSGYRYYPAYLNISADGSGDVVVAVRAKEDPVGTAGLYAAMTMPRDVAIAALEEALASLRS